MIFSSAEFLFLFLPCVLLIYYNPFFRGRRFRNIFLLLVSLFFYAWGEPVNVVLLLASIAANWFFGRMVEGEGPRRRFWLWAAVVLNLAGLFIFKYLGFVCRNLGALGLPMPEIDLALPIGISFYTFQAMSYVIDVYRRRSPAQRSVLDVGLYVSFFPQLIAGPIVRYETIAQEIHGRRETWEDFRGGVPRFIAGLGKKVILSNNMAILADAAFDTLPSLSAPHGLAGSRGLRASDLLRLLRLQRYGHRHGPDVRLPLPGELRQALPGHLHHRLLAALAHLPVHLVPGLRLHPPGGQPGQRRTSSVQPLRGVAPHRDLARGQLDLPPLGPGVLSPADGGEVRAYRQAPGRPPPALDPLLGADAVGAVPGGERGRRGGLLRRPVHRGPGGTSTTFSTTSAT